MAATYEPITTTTLGSSQSSVTIGSGGTISQAYTDLVLIIAGPASTYDGITFRVGNGSVDTGSNYSMTFMQGDGTTPYSGRESNTSLWNLGIQGANFVTTINFMNYSNTTTYKTAISRGNSAANIVRTNVGLWRSTSAINVIQAFTGTGTFSTGCVFTLYGIKAA